jgi:hypothetical protein
MTAEMLAKSRASAQALGLDQVEFREGLAEQLPVADGWAGTSTRPLLATGQQNGGYARPLSRTAGHAQTPVPAADAQAL